MKKVLYVLINNNIPYLIVNNNNLKYFDVEDENNLEVIDNYLEDKIDINSFKIVEKKELIYYKEPYLIVNVEVNDNNFESNYTVKLEECENIHFSYLDVSLLDLYYEEKCEEYNLHEVYIGEREFNNTKKNMLFAAVIAFLIVALIINSNNLNHLGISVPIIEVVIIVLGISSIKDLKNINREGIYLIITSLILSITYAIYTNSLIRNINVFLVPISLLSGLYMINYSNLQISYEDIIRKVVPAITIKTLNFSQIQLIPKVIKEFSFPNFNSSKHKGIIKGILYSIPLLIVLTIMLCSADKMFSEKVESIIYFISRSDIELNFEAFIRKVFFFIIIFAYFYLLLSSFKYKINKKYSKNIKLLDKSMVNTILILINILYLVFTFVQVKYLFIKSSSSLSAEEYSSYARSGFFELLFVVILNVLLVLYFKNKVNDKITSIFSTITTIISINMSITSFYKMKLYIDNYGITRLRFATSIFIVFILIMLLLLTFSLWKKINLFKYCIIIGSIIYMIMNFCNMDKIITKYNLSLNGKNVDMEYITTLSLDSYDIVLKSYKQGKIQEIDFENYINQRNDNSKWYEFIYYNEK